MVGCATLTFRALVYAPGPLRPCPFLRLTTLRLGFDSSAPAESNTSLVFSVVLTGVSNSRSWRMVVSLSASIPAITPNVATAALSFRCPSGGNGPFPVQSTSCSNSSMLTSIDSIRCAMGVIDLVDALSTLAPQQWKAHSADGGTGGSTVMPAPV